jgi:phenylalanyl-tRNA synthetase alpha chain
VLLPGEIGDVGFKQAMQHKWLATDKSGGAPMIVRKVASIVDRAQQLLKDVSDGKDIDKVDAEALKKRKLIRNE